MPDSWVGIEPTFDSPYYPFYKTVNANTLAGAENIPYIILRYLMDLPDGKGYTPKDDNARPRTRLKKLIYYDGALPLDNPMPTTEQIKALQFNPMLPASPQDVKRGYRLYAQEFAAQSQYDSESRVHVYLGNSNSYASAKGFVMRQQIIFKILCNYSLEANTFTTASSRAFAIAQAIVEACNGVNFEGIGGLFVQNITKIDDERENLGYKIYGYIDLMGDAPNINV